LRAPRPHSLNRSRSTNSSVPTTPSAIRSSDSPPPIRPGGRCRLPGVGGRTTWPLTSRPSLYYQPTSNFDRPAPGAEAAHFHYTAGTKAAQRVNNGLKDYRNLADTFTLKTINGRPAFSYVATFTMQGVPHYEYFVRILGTDLIAMFFVQGPVEELETVRREIDQMAATVQLP
jgi:hypothetical protein